MHRMLLIVIKILEFQSTTDPPSSDAFPTNEAEGKIY